MAVAVASSSLTGQGSRFSPDTQTSHATEPLDHSPTKPPPLDKLEWYCLPPLTPTRTYQWGTAGEEQDRAQPSIPGWGTARALHI